MILHILNEDNIMSKLLESLHEALVTENLSESISLAKSFEFDERHPNVLAFNRAAADMRTKRAKILKKQGNMDAHDFQMDIANEHLAKL